ncbi:MAG: DUF1641 domain-containing protein [Saprospiraceae bacterium]|nr:DUF1641 domain-containing protein [Saprospiraceae bacterium]
MDNNGTINWSASEAGQQLQEKLNSERTLRSLDHLLDRIDTLEKAVERLTDVMEQGPGLVSMGVDMADEAYKEAQARGVQIEQRLAAALHLAEKLTAPEMVEKLEQVFDFVHQAPGLVSMTMDMADETYKRAADNGVVVEERLAAALQIAEKLTQPQMVAQLNGLMDTANQLPGLIAMFVDMLDEGYQRAADNGVDLGALSQQGVAAMQQASEIMNSEEFKALQNSGVLSPATLGVIAKTGEALVESQQQPVKKMGLFGLMGALNDKDRQKALGFLMNFTKSFGQKL